MAGLAGVLTLAEKEHVLDQGRADEIVESLEEFVCTERISNPDMLGYMLRGFFESQRRHMAWEKHVVLPLAQQQLSAEDHLHLSHSMADPVTMAKKFAGK